MVYFQQTYFQHCQNWIYANWIETKIEYAVEPTRALSWYNVPIEHVTPVTSLGTFINENLPWQTHMDKLSN